jgi:hypothetical protein
MMNLPGISPLLKSEYRYFSCFNCHHFAGENISPIHCRTVLLPPRPAGINGHCLFSPMAKRLAIPIIIIRRAVLCLRLKEAQNCTR